MEFIIENIELIILVLLVVIILVLIRVYVYNIYFSKYFTNRKFQVRSAYEIDPKTNGKCFNIYIYNKNINDVSINSMGFIYRNQSIDYFKTYKASVISNDDTKLVIPSRDSIKVVVPIDQFETVLFDNNRGKRKIAKIRAYVTDSLGVQTTFCSKSIRKIVAKDLKQINRIKYQEIKKMFQERKIEKRKQRNLKKEINRIKKAKEETHKFHLKTFVLEFIGNIKNKFKKK